MRKNIVIYWCDFRGKKSNLLSFLGSKKKVYLNLFDEISKKHDLFLCFGSENSIGKMKFKGCYLYDGQEFKRKKDIIKADAVLDRSRNLSFPGKTKAEKEKILNQIDFKILAGDKWTFYNNFKKYCPQTHLAESKKDLAEALVSFEDDEKVVIKPRFGLKGNGIIIGKKKDVQIDKISKYPVIVQEFCETKGGFLYKTLRNDIRVVIINGKPVYSVIRIPKKGSLLANVAQGGSIRQIPLESLPREVTSIVSSISRTIKKSYNNPFYSIDFGITKNGPVVFELNNFIGFPLIKRKNHDIFVTELAKVLSKKAEK